MNTASKEYLREMIHRIYEPFLKEGNTTPSIRTTRPSREGVIDESTFQVLEIDKLFDALNTARTIIGQATLYRSLAQPLRSAEIIKAKQEALREIEENTDLREKLDELVAHAAKREYGFYRLLYGTFTGYLGSSRSDMEIDGYGYGIYKKGVAFIRQLVKDAQSFPAPKSSYLKILMSDFEQFSSSRIYSLMRGPVYLSESGVKAREEKNRWIPGIKFRPTLVKPGLIITVLLGIFLLTKYGSTVLGISFSINPVYMIFFLPALLFYAPVVGTFDRDSCIYPLRNRFRSSEETHTTLEALGKIDELLSFYRYGQSFGSAVSLPKIIEAKRHSFLLRKARNPILGQGDPNYVPNDIDLDEERLTFISGPNSGGKTAFCKTIGQIQLLSQVGCYVPAEEAEVSIAERIFYQVPEISSLEDVEGRFGKELERTKNMFLATTPTSLIILDELSEGTTHQEKLETSFHILNGFYRIGNTTLLVTHNYELAERFKQEEIGQYFQVEFIGEGPTYKLKEGISRVSHAGRVARKVGFAKEDIERYLKERGFIKK